MQLVAHHSSLLLDRRDTISLIDAAGAIATLEKGCLWITMDGDIRDIVLAAGQSWTVERNGRTLLHAEAPSTLRITAPVPERTRRPALQDILAAVADWAERAFQRMRAPYY